MKRPALSFAFVTSLFCSSMLSAQQPAAAVPQADLQAAADRLAAARAVVEKQRVDRIAVAKNWYTGALDKLQKDVTAKGDLDAVLAVKAETGRMDRELTPEERVTMPEWLRAARANYEKALAQISDQAAAGEIAVLNAHLTALEAVQKRLTQAGDIDNALKVKQERTMVGEQIANLENVRKKAAAVAPASAASVTAKATAPAKTAMAPMVASGTPAPVMDVAEELRVKSGLKGPGTGVIGFNAPGGDGRKGAKGLLIKNDPQTGKNGTTWSFAYTRGGTAYGLQIIHPHGRGQILVSLNKGNVAVSVPDEWSEIGWGGGHSKPPMRMTKDSEAIFPLADDTEYQVESKVTSTGGVEVSVNGKLVATGHATGASPLSLEIPDGKQVPLGGRGKPEFTGDGLPLKWETGFAGLIVGPMDGGQNVCRQVKFRSSATTAR